MASAEEAPSKRLAELLDNSARIEELGSASEDEVAEEKWELADNEEVTPEDQDDDDSSSEIDGQNVHGWMGAKLKYNIPPLFAHPSLLHDTLVTETSEKHDKVMRTVLDILTNTNGAQEIQDPNSYNLPRLQREKHIKFLRGVLGNYPPPFQVMDASRPWLLYWALAGLSFLGLDVSSYKERTIQTFTPLQNPDGGFGGGYGQLSHCAAGYAATLSLAMVGALDMIDRRSMWRWLGSVKQPDGSFTMAVGGEKDIRGAYCGMTIHTLLNLPLDLPPHSPAKAAGLTSFTDKLGEWISLCQTYEGGIGGAPTNEAHGAYAFCGLACLCLLDAPHRSIPKYLDLPRLTSCLSSLQSAPEGSFAGRTNKLVDACYSHWVGSCWALVEAALETPNTTFSHGNSRPASLWSRQGLVRYSLSCSQAKKGGLRDKPGTRPDGYHTCYSLAGLSAAQNHYLYVPLPGTEENTSPPIAEDGTTTTTDQATTALTAAFNWRAEQPTTEEMKDLCLDETDLVGFVHPVFVLPMGAVDNARRQFGDKIGF